jgi:hypothetical protein
MRASVGGAMAARKYAVLPLSPPGRQGDRQDEIIVFPMASGSERLLRGRRNSYPEVQQFLQERRALG